MGTPEHNLTSLLEFENSTAQVDLSHQDRPTYLYVVSAVIVFLAIACVSTNVLTLVIVCKRPVLRHRSRQMLISLAVADVLVGGAAAIMAGRLTLLPCGAFPMDKVLTVLESIPLHVSLDHMLLIAGDRFLAIVFPLRYETLVTGRRIRIAIVIVWVINTVVAVVSTIWSDHMVSFVSCGYDETGLKEFLICALVMFWTTFALLIYMYCRIWCVARKHRLKMREQVNHLTSDIESHSSSKRRPCKSTRTITMILVTFLITFMPLEVLAWLYFLDWIEDTPHSLPHRLLLACFCLVICKSCSNFFIYAVANKHFSKAYKSLLCCGSKPGLESKSSSSSSKKRQYD